MVDFVCLLCTANTTLSEIFSLSENSKISILATFKPNDEDGFKRK